MSDSIGKEQKTRTRHSKLKEARRSRKPGSGKSPGHIGSRRIAPEGSANMNGKGKARRGPQLTVDTSEAYKDDPKHNVDTRETDASTPSSDGARTPAGVRGSRDLRSPGIQKTPVAVDNEEYIPDFITQTDKFGNATTPRSKEAVKQARQEHPSGPEPHLHVAEDGSLSEDGEDIDACETLFDSIRLMCCCLLPEDDGDKTMHESSHKLVFTESEHPEEDCNVKLLGKHHPDDFGKKCLVLDLDETLVHSSFRAVPGADFVIPVQIEDVVHFVYVAKRPGVDEFLTEMAKHYEIVIYTASLNKYADPLLDLLDPNRVIRARLFRESCVYYEGNYVKDLSLLNRDLSQSIIIDNSPASYIFHPENAIDCTSFIDDPKDRELDQIGDFLVGISNVEDVRGVAPRWREWPNVELELLSETGLEDDKKQ